MTKTGVIGFIHVFITTDYELLLLTNHSADIGSVDKLNTKPLRGCFKSLIVGSQTF